MPETVQQAKRSLQADTMTALVGALVLVAVSLGVHAYEYPGSFRGFAAWGDQARYLQAARAWAQWDLLPSEHHYPPYYPLLGAAFVRLTPWQPFMIPDALCWAACLPIFLRLATRLAPDWPPAASAACFLVGTLGGRRLLELWVIPWTTTGVAPCQFGALLLAFRLAERPGWARALPLGLVIGAAAGFRPSDAAVLLPCGLGAAWALARSGAGLRRWCGTGLAGALGLAVGALPAIAAHYAVFGGSAGLYLSAASANGFEWRLLPMRWVMLVGDARPLLPSGLGMAEVFPWLLPGFGGLLLALLRRDTPGAAPVLAAASVVLHWTLYLSYRDLQPAGLWRFDNVHYFKWTFPLLVLWAAQLAAALCLPGARRRAGCVLAGCALLASWRPVLRDATPAQAVLDGRTIRLSAGPSSLGTALRLNLQGGWDALYFDFFPLQAGGRRFENTRDFKVVPVPGGALLLPLRELPAGPAALDLLPGVSAGVPLRAELARQAIVPGLPCGLAWWDRSCRPAS